MSDFDEFGDLSLLANFDVDKAVQEHEQKKSPSPKKNPPSTKTEDDMDDSMDNLIANVDMDKVENEAKKRKVSLSPAAVSSSSSKALTTQGTAQADALRKVLRDVFGYFDFRKGQIEVIQALLQQRDVSVYWATGRGKSLCYQIPALFSDQVAIVVSPLISLMQDQCHKLNALSEKPVAAYLGSAQTNVHVEDQAWTGAFRVVYLTPEKLTSCLDRMTNLHRNHRRIALVAIDEAHTVSEWGTDFRPDFRKLSCLRQHQVLKEIPLLTLTATAVPRVQQDISKVLNLRQPVISLQSLDRKNLRLAIHSRPSNPVSALQSYITMWNDPTVRPNQQSTIIYVATRSQVDQVTAALQHQVSNPAIRVAGYHAGLSTDIRQRVHTQFLTGQTAVLVATVAFGMGIDKPDTRRIIHYGPPKTMEEYYQQIGRAGRDGASAEAVMYTNGSDFDKYRDDFYVGNLPQDAREATLQSLGALKSYCLSKSQCRRHVLLSYFGEKPSFQHCRNCDVCEQIETFGDDLERDFSDMGALLILRVVASLKEQSLAQIVRVLNGNKIEPYRYRGVSPEQLQSTVQSTRETIPHKVAAAYFEQLFSLLCQKGYLATKQMKGSVNGFERSWMVYYLTPQGHRALDHNEVIRLPVPDYLRDLEKKEEERRKKVLENLQKSGFQDKIPSEEIEKGDGEIIRAYSKWHNYVETARGLGKTDRVEQLELLLSSIELWRSQMAEKYQMAPVSVIPEHILASLAYTVASMPPGSKMDASSLIAVGVRSREIHSLVNVLGEWAGKAQHKVECASDGTTKKSEMITPTVSERPPWKYAVYKPQKKTGMAVWEQSYKRYMNGESIHSIAMSPSSGRQPIQVETVAGHILDAVVHGRAVDLEGLLSIFPVPTRDEWERIHGAHVAAALDPTADPETSGKDGGKYTQTDAIRPIVGKVVDVPYNERSEADSAVLSHWFDRLKWYLALKRGGIEPAFK